MQETDPNQELTSSSCEKNISKERINAINFERIINTYVKNGMIIITASEYERTDDTNTIQNEILKKDIKAAGYSFLPIMGGDVSTDIISGSNEEMLTTFFIVHSKGKNHELFELGKLLAAKFEQKVFIYSDGESLNYYDSEGNIFSAKRHLEKSGKDKTVEMVYYININSPTINGNVIRLARGEDAIFKR